MSSGIYLKYSESESECGEGQNQYASFPWNLRVRSCQGGIDLVELETRTERDEFRRRLKDEWKLLWRERYDDKLRAEGVAVKDYPLLLMERGYVVFASRQTKTPSFSDVVEYWALKGNVYSPNPNVGGWGKFVRTHISSRKENYDKMKKSPEKTEKKQQLRKNGRGWLHA